MDLSKGHGIRVLLGIENVCSGRVRVFSKCIIHDIVFGVDVYYIRNVLRQTVAQRSFVEHALDYTRLK